MKTIPLTNSDKVAFVDDADFEEVSKFSWGLQSDSGYVRRSFPRAGGPTKHQYLHHFLIGSCKGLLVDHKDGNHLNYQRGNLRFATWSQNNANRKKSRGRSIYKGVLWSARLKKWIAKITCNHKQIHLGVFEKEIAAALAYDTAAKKYFGEFARLNFP